MSQIFFVYLLIFSNSKIYVGMSRTDAKGLRTRRYNQHAADARRGKNRPVYHAWRKYGAPEMLVLSEHAARQECVEAERAAIVVFETIDPAKGYNLAHGGEGLNAPKGSAVHTLMTQKVWLNPERSAKLSAALKGRPVSQITVAAYREWLENGGRQKIRDRVKSAWERPGHRESMRVKTSMQMTDQARQHLRRLFTGREDPRSPEGKEAHRQKRTAFSGTEEGKNAARRGQAAMWSDPKNRARHKEKCDAWRASEANRENCREMTMRAAAINRKPIEDLQTGKVYTSQQEMAAVLGLSAAAISLRIKNGKARRI